MIACVYIPDVVSLVERANGRSASKQIVLVDAKGKVQAASLKATQYGVRLGMTFRKAVALCVDADVLAFEDEPYRETSETIVAALTEFTDKIEPVTAFWQFTKKSKKQANPHPSAAIYYLDFGKLRGDDVLILAAKVVKHLRDSLNVSASIGVAEGKFTAHVAARFAAAERPKFIKPGEEAEYLAPYSINLLPFDKETSRRMRLLGINMLGDFAALPSGAVFAQLGKHGRILQDLARGIDRRPVLPPPIKPVEYLIQHFDGAVEDKLQVEAALAMLGCEIERRLQARGYALRMLNLHVQLDNGNTLHADYTCRRPTSNGQLIGRLLIRLFTKLEVTSGVVNLSINTGELVPMVWQQLELFAAPQTAERRLQEMLENLTARFGSDSLFQVEPMHSSHRIIERRFRFQEVEAL